MQQGNLLQVMSVVGQESLAARTKKVAGLKAGNGDEVKRTNEIKTTAPMLDAIDIAGCVVSGDRRLSLR